MVILWIGLPLFTLLIRFLNNPDPESIQIIPTTFITITVLTTLAGALASIMLSTTIVNERTNGVYDLFLIRPVKKYEILLAKYLSVISCLVIAIFASLIVGMLFDTIVGITIDPLHVFYDNIESLVVSAASLSISCSMGLLFGMLLDSVAAAAILSYYLGSQLSVIIMLPQVFLPELNMMLIAPLIGLSATVIIIFLSLFQFKKKLR